MAVSTHPTSQRSAFLKELALKTLANWSEDNVPRLAAAFSFYAILSLAPLLVLAVAIGGMYLGNRAVEGRVISEATATLGGDSAKLIGSLIDSAHQKTDLSIAALISLVVTFFSASNLFLQLDDSVNAIWDIKQTGSAVRNLVVTRIVAFLSVLVFGAIVLAWLVLDSWLTWIAQKTPGFQGWPYLSFGVAVVFLIGVFAVSFKSLPKGKVAWKDVWIPAVVTGVGIAASKFLLSLYFSHAGVSKAYGPAGSLVVILLWIYYTSQIYFFGIELTYTYAHHYGSRQGIPTDDVQYS